MDTKFKIGDNVKFDDSYYGKGYIKKLQTINNIPHACVNTGHGSVWYALFELKHDITK